MAPPAETRAEKPAAKKKDAEPLVPLPALTPMAEEAFVAIFTRYRRDVQEAGEVDADKSCDVLTRRFRESYARHLFETPASAEDAACEALDEMDAFVQDRRERRLRRKTAARDAAVEEKKRQREMADAVQREKRAAEAERQRTLLSLRDDRDDRQTRRQIKKGPLADRRLADATPPCL